MVDNTDSGNYEVWSDEHELVDSSALPHYDRDGLPIPVTIPIELAPGVQVIYTTRLGGSSVGDVASLNLSDKAGDDPAAVRTNRFALEHAIGAPITVVPQIHSAHVMDVDTKPWESVSDLHDLATVPADALVSGHSGIALGVFVADCLPVLLTDPTQGIVAAAHCGRKGLETGVIRSTIELMLAKGAQLGHIVATFGPAICADCYEVGDDMTAAFSQHFPNTSTRTRFGGSGIDIVGAAKQELQSLGVCNFVDSYSRMAAATQYLCEDDELQILCDQDGEGPRLSERMHDMNHPQCTLENPLWYSHRRATMAKKEREGRMLALIIRR